MNEKQTLSASARQQIATDFAKMVSGKMDQGLVDSATKSLSAGTTAYPAHGSIASIVVWERVQVIIDNGKTFDGDAWGVSTPGGGALFGDVYTDDIAKLYSDTDRFALSLTSVYTAVYFMDKHSTYLGSFQAGSISTVAGTGGGKGKWS